MAGIQNFQPNRNKATKGINIFKKEINYNKNVKNQTKSEKLMEGVAIWGSFYRANPQRFAKEYLELNLKIFQQILIYIMMNFNYVLYLASRGQGKSWLTAVFCCIRCILYPETRVIIASGSIKQSREVIEKIDDLRKSSPNLAREISDLSTSTNDPKVEFHNGSWVKVVASNNNARHSRANLLIVDEFRMVLLDIITKVLRKFLTAPRQPKYLNNPKYAHLKERNKEIYLSSAWYKSHWSWQKVVTYFNAMTGKNDQSNPNSEPKKYFLCGLPYQLAIKENLLDKEQVLDEMAEADFDPTAWSMEMECMFFGESENAYFKLNELHKCRTIKKPNIPMSKLDFIKNKGKPRKSNKQLGEVRILSMDIALMAGNANDNTIFTFMRLLPKGNEYIRNVSYMESMNGDHSTTQAIRLKQLYYDLDCDYVVMDCGGNGMSVYDDCVKVLYDDDRDIEYPAWKAMNNEDMANRAMEKNALPIIYSIKVVKAEVNHEMALGLKSCIEKRKINFLVDELIGREHLGEKTDFNTKSIEEQAFLSRSYIQTSLTINEMVSLDSTISGGFLKLKEVGRNRKDRYSSLSYCNYYANILEKKLADEDDDDPDDELVYY